VGRSGPNDPGAEQKRVELKTRDEHEKAHLIVVMGDGELGKGRGKCGGRAWWRYPSLPLSLSSSNPCSRSLLSTLKLTSYPDEQRRNHECGEGEWPGHAEKTLHPLQH
jgi:hypothetical protein